MQRAVTVDEVIAATSGDAPVHPKKRKRLEKLSSEQLIAYQLRTLLINACRDLNPNRAYQLYNQARADGLIPAVDAVNHILCLLAGLGEPGSGCHRSMDAGSNLKKAIDIYTDAKAAGVDIHEPSYSALIRCYCSNDLALDALDMFEQLEKLKLTPKHRTFTPLLDALSRGHHTDKCFALFARMVETHDLIPQEKDYTSMLRLCLETSDERFWSLMDSLMEDVLLPESQATIDVLRSWFSSRRDQSNQPLYHIHDSVPSSRGDFDNSEWEAELRAPTYALRSIDLAEEQRSDLLNQINAAAVDRLSNPRKKPVQTENNAATAKDPAQTDGAEKPRRQAKMIVDVKYSCSSWESFLTWIQTMEQNQKNEETSVVAPSMAPIYRSEGPFDIMIDGANVGYFKQNYAGAPAHIDYFQVDAMIKYLQSTGRRVLLVLHCRHLHPNTVPAGSVEVIKKWAEEGLLLTAPAGSNDDWFWLYAALRWRCQVVTNDEMRDHHFRMLSPRYFNRWKERNQIHFSFEGGKMDGASQEDKLGKKRIKLATSTAASVVHEQSYIRMHPVQRQKAAEEGGNVGGETADAEKGVTNKRGHEQMTECSKLTGLRRRNIVLHVPMYYSNRMQKALSTESAAYYFPLVEQVPEQEKTDAEAIVPDLSTQKCNSDDDAGADSDPERSHLQPLVPPPALVVADNAVPIVSRWMCCVAVQK